MKSVPLDTFHLELGGAHWGCPGELLKSLGRGHDPVAVMLTCGELGGIPDEVAHAQPGEVMVVQNLAGIVPPAGEGNPGSEVATICYALGMPSLRHFIVCGHRGCRVVPELLSDRRPERFAEFREIIAEIREELSPIKGTISSDEFQQLAVQKVMLQQIHHLWSYQEIRRRLQADVRLHVWMYDEQTAIAHWFDPQSRRFCRHLPRSPGRSLC